MLVEVDQAHRWVEHHGCTAADAAAKGRGWGRHAVCQARAGELMLRAVSAVVMDTLLLLAASQTEHMAAAADHHKPAGINPAVH